MYPDDVSPPDSVQGNSQRSSLEVSPIESPSLKVGPFVNGSIPKPKKKITNNGGAGVSLADWRGRGASLPIRDSSLTTSTRWDDFSGEPTSSEKGKTAQASHGTMNFETEPSHKRHSGTSVNNMSNINIGGQNRKRLSIQRIDHVFNPKEGWKGASGRHAILNPLLDKPLPPGKSHTFPARTQKPLDKPLGRISYKQTSVSPVALTTQPDLSQKSCMSENGPITPLGFLHTSLNSSSHVAIPVGYQKPDHGGFSRPNSMNKYPINSDINEAKQNIFLHSVRAKPAINLESHEAAKAEHKFRSKMHHMHLEDQPPSRFSTTTYATTTCDSPPVTPEINSESPTPTPTSSLLNRRRPVPTAGMPGANVTARKPTPSDIRKSAAAELTEKNLKLLPMSPPEAQAATRVASLQAKLDNLRRRRFNLKTVIHELTNVVQPSSIAYDMASRQEIKKTVDGLNKELSEVIKEEHETGLQLHRAWKREDETSNFESSSLWVKRLAS